MTAHIGRPPVGGGVIINHRTHFPAVCEQCGEGYMRQQNKPEQRFCCLKCKGAAIRGAKVWHLYKHGESGTPAYRDRKHARERKRWPEKNAARRAVCLAVKSGRLSKPTACQQCGIETERRQLHGHHCDYARQLDVLFVCVPCHAAIHAVEQVKRRA